ncbi:MAG: hypothetical protein U0746_17495 [Gemmataceae bacterium]
MRVRSVLVAVVVAIPSLAGADEPLPAVLPPPPPPPPVVAEAPAVTGGMWFDSDRSPQPFFGMDVMLGQQMGVRPNVAVWRTDTSAIVVEGFYGALLTKLAQSEGAGGGLRWLFTRGSRDGCNTVVVGPGMDVLYNFTDGQATFLAPTVDIAWRHNFGERSGWTLGLNAGVGVGVSGRRDCGCDAAGTVTPLISGFFGLRF